MYKDIVDHRSYIHNISSCEIKAWEKFGPERDSNPWPLQYRCSALPTELSSQQGAGLIASSIYDIAYIHLHSSPTLGILRIHNVTSSPTKPQHQEHILYFITWLN